jgi:hypothetical protein
LSFVLVYSLESVLGIFFYFFCFRSENTIARTGSDPTPNRSAWRNYGYCLRGNTSAFKKSGFYHLGPYNPNGMTLVPAIAFTVKLPLLAKIDLGHDVVNTIALLCEAIFLLKCHCELDDVNYCCSLRLRVGTVGIWKEALEIRKIKVTRWSAGWTTPLTESFI